VHNVSAQHVKAVDTLNGAKLVVNSATVNTEIAADTVKADHVISKDLKVDQVK
jgi:hypothetical protein